MWPGYVIAAMARVWKERGISTIMGPRFDTAADVGILHLDRSRLGPDDVPDPPAGKPVINWNVRDIGKRKISILRVLPGDNWDGPVMVKTDLNNFGKAEAKARGPVTPTPQMRNRARMAEISWRSARRLPERQYPVLNSLRAVPGWVWEDESLIVERFVPERDGEFYCLRGWMFLGSRGYGWRLRSTHPMAKAGTRVDHEYLYEVPDELVALRAQHKFDFGKFDYVMHDGKALCFDMNKTPTFTGEGTTPRMIDLSHGIEDFL
jgi:hypothetical protein